MTVLELINYLEQFEDHLPVYAYNESGYMKKIKVKPINVQLKKTTKYEPISLILINPDKV